MTARKARARAKAAATTEATALTQRSRRLPRFHVRRSTEKQIPRGNDRKKGKGNGKGGEEVKADAEATVGGIDGWGWGGLELLASSCRVRRFHACEEDW